MNIRVSDKILLPHHQIKTHTHSENDKRGRERERTISNQRVKRRTMLIICHSSSLKDHFRVWKVILIRKCVVVIAVSFHVRRTQIKFDRNVIYKTIIIECRLPHRVLVEFPTLLANQIGCAFTPLAIALYSNVYVCIFCVL